MRLTLLVGLAVFIAGSVLVFVLPGKLLVGVRFVQGLGAAALSTVSMYAVTANTCRPPSLARSWRVCPRITRERWMIGDHHRA